ncbi:uncharacterized protein BXZ73DRAFT_91608 [Epithele typhae]|uniref:uncharacterized protein n=1 Tax=Epithele typhae TaxID=378194 RepID=UPI002007EB55|nr:uncharacterized protein BXZ73DRAFT_91608 [Epithele typhae]KAH9922317.1 hypothetical protein BXZ73DRAFT_91608 [Epithele typhae]
MARRLGDQLLADIAKAQAEVAAAGVAASEAPVVEASDIPVLPESPPPPLPVSLQKKKDAALLTMQAILATATKHPLVAATMSSLQVPGDGGCLLDVLTRCVSASAVSKPLARTLVESIVSLAKSDALFASPRHSDASSQQLDKGKRKRDEAEETGALYSQPPPKRVAMPMPIDQPDLLYTIGEALRVVSHTLSGLSSHVPTIDPGVISSIQLPLHQIFLFAVTSAPRAGDGRMQVLQELAGLVQMLGVLSGIHIGHPPPPWPGAPALAPSPDIGTAVYPCLVPGCPKTFHRLYSLRAHQRLHTIEHRPYRCMQCPASFVRNHDLKRHTLLHDKKAWRCAGCNKIFSRRDAIKRHKDARGRAVGGKGRPGAEGDVDGACAFAEIEEVEVDKVEGEEEISRRAKLWNGIAASSAGTSVAEHLNGPEDGEMDPGVIHQAQHMVLGIHALLQGEVTKGLGAPAATPPTSAPQLSQSTLASIIARAQQATASQEGDGVLGDDEPAQDELPSFDAVPMDVESPADADTDAAPNSLAAPPSLSLSWLSEEQTRLLEQAIAQAASAAQAQAEVEAAQEEEDEEEDEDDEAGM